MRQLGGDPEAAWLGCLKMAENWDFVTKFIEGMAKASKNQPAPVGRKGGVRHRPRRR